MSDQCLTISDAFKKRVWLVAFDMDQTSLDIHTSGVAIKDNEVLPDIYMNCPYRPRPAREILSHVKESIKEIIPSLLKNGIAVAICTNTDVLMAGHSSLMGGRELVEYIFGNTFDEYPYICDHLIIEAWRGNLDAVRTRGKNNHIARVWERMDSEQKHYSILGEEPFQEQIRTYTGDYFDTIKEITPLAKRAMISHTLLIDDDPLNIQLAKYAGYMSFKVKETGLEKDDWLSLMTMIEHAPEHYYCFFQITH